MKKNREGFLVSENERECTNCRTIFRKTNNTMTWCHSCNLKRVSEQNPSVRMYRRAKSRAKILGLEFSINKEDVVIPENCPVLGMPLKTYSGKSGGRFDSPSLDRIDNSKGYTKDNIMVISHLANMMKGCASTEQLLKFSSWVQKTFLQAAT